MSDSAVSPAIAMGRVAEFCQRVVTEHSEHWPISEKTLAEEFLAFTGLHLVANLEEVSEVCQSKLGISVSRSSMPDGLRGHNFSYGKERKILIATDQDYYGATLHTLLHELREILESEFRGLDHPIAGSDNADLEKHAEDFATTLQVTAAFKAVPIFFESAREIERKWLRIGAYLLIILGAIAYTLSCLSTTQIESNLANSRLA